MVGNVGSQNDAASTTELSTKGHEGPRRDTKKSSRKNEFLRYQAVGAVAFPRLAARGFSYLKNPGLPQCRGFGESGEAAVGVKHPANRDEE